MRRSAAALAVATALAACGGGDQSTAPVVTASTVSISPGDPSLAVGATVALSATPRDASGNVLTGRSVAWTTSRAEVATVNGASGLVTAVSPGFAIIRATVDQRTATVLVTVIAPVTSVQITARRTTMGVSGSLQLSASTRDANGATLLDRAVTWTSSDESKARVSASGLATGVAPGSVTITATSEGVAGTIGLLVADLPLPQITTVAPATLGPGVTATISGANFDTNPADLDVTVAGVVAVVTAATPTQLTVRLPAFIPCQPTQNATVSVSGVGGTATRAHPLQVAHARSVAVGEMLVLSGTDVRCNELPATAARYALAVVNASRVPAATAGFEFRGLAGATASAAATVGGSVSLSSLSWEGAGGRSAGRLSSIHRGAMAMHAHAHAAWRERERALVRSLGRPPRTVRRGMRAQVSASSYSAAGAGFVTSVAAAPVPLDVGATTTLKFRTSDANCTESRPVTARVVYAGTKSVILESTDAPLAGTMDADYIALGTEYDNTMHGVLTQYFGDPLAFDASTDNNARIVMLFAKAVNDRSAGLLGFVTACDLFPPSDPRTTASNQAEIFYARVPTLAEGVANNIETRAGWRHIIRGTVIHEAKHIVSFAERFATPEEAFPEENWLEEATAQAAIELWGRATYYAGKAAWKGNATYASTMRCDVRPTDASCGGQPSIIADHFIRLFAYYEGIETKSYFNTTRSDGDVYGSGWLFTRWAADNYATDEAAFFKALTQSWRDLGISNIELRTGRSHVDLVTEFMMSLFADDLPGFTPAPGARYTIPSWNTRDMFLGMSQDFTRGGQPIPAFPLRVHGAQFGAFNADVGVLAGGGAAYVDLSGTPTGPQILDLRGPGGAGLPADTPLRLAILRLQ